jgi:AraC family transcriptional regulator, regulatory protein of adaptative response / DNA-3-methyladenine glycosylase II
VARRTARRSAKESCVGWDAKATGGLLEGDACYRALVAKDGRFDGVFFVGVKTTGIYCRPICPARTPGRDRCEFFARAAEAESAGFRACFRCRPELAPGNANVDSVPRLVQSALSRIEAGYLNEGSIDELAKELGVTSRHLRRAMEQELGVSPIQLAQTRRLALAKQLLEDSRLPLTEIAFASGFSSLRRFNAAFRERFGCAPSKLERREGARAAGDEIVLRLDYRAPFDFDGILAYLARRAIPAVEKVADGEYRRTVALEQTRGEIGLSLDRSGTHLRARVSLSLAPRLMTVVSRIRALFDLDAQPTVIAEHLRMDPLLREHVFARPGLRVPGAFDPFETAVRAILGQQISVRAATTLSGRLAAAFGRPIATTTSALERTFPTPEVLARSTIDEIARLGMPARRAATVIELARAVHEARIDLSGAPEEAASRLVDLPGIGEWTAQYIAMRALRWSNAFPAGDLGVLRALGVKTARAARERACTWEPWRAYAVMHLWAGSSDLAKCAIEEVDHGHRTNHRLAARTIAAPRRERGARRASLL